jgi:uncharacterized protein YciI/catechol 2,3-dioxygenase-like lactoylglutathione lyase family enzyme
MEKATGIGGLFFRARDPAALQRWYQEHLGVNPTPSSYDELPWWQEAGPTVFAPFPEATDYFGDAKRAWMVNFRVRNLDALATQLRAAGIAVKIDEQHYPNGRFARLHDPEGNPIELWEPAGPDAPRQAGTREYYALLYHVVDDFVSRRSAYREEHLRLVHKAHRRGELLLAGALAEPADRALLVFRAADRSVVEAFARNDPYVTSGLVTRWEVRPWAVVIGDDALEAITKAV